MQRLFSGRTALPGAPWWLSAVVGRWRRKKGVYDKTTLACFYAAWRKRHSLASLIAYLKFRRDLGYAAPRYLLKSLLASFTGLNPESQRRVFNWFWEIRGEEPQEVLTSDTLRSLAESSPPAAAALVQRCDLIPLGFNSLPLSVKPVGAGLPAIKGLVSPELFAGKPAPTNRYPVSLLRGSSFSGNVKALAILQNQQVVWRKEFSAYLSAHRGDICVVGNAATVANSAIGRTIDTQDVVFRFNRFSVGVAADDSLAIQRWDRGSRLSVWVCAPNLHVPYPPVVDSVEWVIISGPDVRYHLADWGSIISLLNAEKRVLTVPLGVWRMLVRNLKAPPSAGILCLAWVIEMLGTPEGLKAVGFQRQILPGVRYHYALHRNKPSQRHNWERERTLLRHWETQGLQFLD